MYSTLPTRTIGTKVCSERNATKVIIRSLNSKDRQYNGQKKDRQYNGQKKDRQYNGQKKDRQYNGQKKDRQHNGQKKDRKHNGQKKTDKRNKTTENTMDKRKQTKGTKQ